VSRVGADVPSEVGEPATGDPGDQPDQPVRSWTERRLLVWGGLFALVALPLLVATVALRRPPWYPALDFAMTELRLRDVGTRHTPLIGLPGRIGPRLEEQGSHPGPLSFYLLAPVYRLFGSSGWAMQVGAVALNLAALGSALAIAVRRGGARLGLGVAAMLVLLVAGYGPAMLTQPWNPYLPLLWWVVLLLAVWAVICGDVAMLPLAVFAATLCSQTHVSYLGLVAVVGAVAVVGVVLAWRRAPSGSPERRTVVRWSAVSLVLALVLWLPPLIDQLVHDPGNMRAIADHLATPSEPPLGQVRAIKLVLLHLDVPAFLSRGTSWVGALPDPSVDPRGSLIPGAVVLAVWALAWLAAVRLRHRALMRLHLVVAAGLVASVVSTSRIFGKDWYYLTLWAWGVAALLVLAVGWTAVAVLGDRAKPERRPRLSRAVTVGLGGLVAVVSLAVAVGAVRTDPPDSRLSATLAAVLPDTLSALERGEGAATGRDGRYLVLFSDTMYFGSQAYGIVDELERRGFDAGMPELFHVPVTRHRVVDPGDATAAIVIANGQNVERLRNIPGAVEVASVDPRDADDKAEYDRVRDALVQQLEGDGLDELVPHVDGNLYALAIDPRASQSALRKVSRLLELGSPTAVFVAPPDVAL
jgi:hypothetical protein